MRGACELVEATVQVGVQEIPYLRRGRGADPILLLAPDREERLRILGCIESCRPVVAPALPSRIGGSLPDAGAAAAEAARWLCRIVEGLGLNQPLVVLAGGLKEWASGIGRAAPVLGAVLQLRGDETVGELFARLDRFTAGHGPGAARDPP